MLLACAGEQLDDSEREHFAKLTGGEREPGDGVLCEAFVGIGGQKRRQIPKHGHVLRLVGELRFMGRLFVLGRARAA